MTVFAFDLRVAGSSAYRDAIVDLAAVHLEDGEVADSFHSYLGLNDYLSYRPSILRDSHVSFKALQTAAPYHDGVGDFCAWLDAARGPLPVWGFEAREKGAFVQSSLKYSKLPTGFDRLADAGALFGVLAAVGAAPPGPVSFEHVLHRLEMPLPSPRVDALERAKMTATAVAMLEDELRRFYTFPTSADPLRALPAPTAPVGFDPFADDPAPLPYDGDPERYRKAFFATLGERGLKYEGRDAKAAVRAFIAESPLWDGGPVESASRVPPHVFAERLGPLGRWKDREVEIPVLDAYLEQQAVLGV